MNIKTIGVLIADEYEYLPFCDFVKEYSPVKSTRRSRESIEFMLDGKRVIAVKCGIGKVTAAASTAFLIADEHCDVIINEGLSGAVSRFSVGDVVAGSTCRECDFDLTALGYKPGENPSKPYLHYADGELLEKALNIPGIHAAVLGSGDLFLTDSVKKKFFASTFGTEVFDMESAAIASACEQAGVPFLVLRKLSDSADDEATASYREMNERQEIALAEITMSIIKEL